MPRLTRDPIDAAALTAAVQASHRGAVVLFLGTVRDRTGDELTAALDYAAYEEMADKVIADTEAEARRRWPGAEVLAVHRLGYLPVGEVSVAVAAAAPHRDAAFAAARFAIDEIKARAPIWKKDFAPTGDAAWKES